jgi:hypothetical protein
LELTSAEEAEEFAKEWLQSKYRNRIAKLRFSQVMLESGVWTIRAELELKQGVLSTIRQDFVLKIDGTSGKVLGYREGSAGI